MRDHTPVLIDKFNGLWSRGNVEETPLDHFAFCNNIQYIASAKFKVRDGIDRHQTIAVPLSNILRLYNYPTNSANTLLVLTQGGNIYHVVNSSTMYGPILTIAAMTDFAFANYGGRAYISPFTTEVQGDLNVERGLQNDFLYVYKGDGTVARKAGGTVPTTTITVVNSANTGGGDAGLHIFGYVYETDTGYLTSPGGLVAFTTDGIHSLDFSTISNSPDSFVVKKHLVASKFIINYNGDVNGYTLYFIPDAIIPNNSTTTLNDISFFDADLLEDASHLLDNFVNPPAGANLCTYHNRLCILTPYDNPSDVWVSAPGEPEAFNNITGLLEVPPTGDYITNGAEQRDVLYIMKRARTVAFVDNGNDPTTWSQTLVDASLGCGVHGIASVLDTHASGVDYIIVSTYRGITLFNGLYVLPELSWKVSAFWSQQDFKNSFRIIQMINDPVQQRIYCVTTDNNILYGDYTNGFDPKNIRWSPWTFDVNVNALALVNVSDLLLGCDQ